MSLSTGLKKKGKASALFRPIAFHRPFVDWTGSINAALFLSQLLYWTETVDWDYKRWIYKTHIDLEDELGMTSREQVTTRRYLVASGLVEERKFGVPAKMHFRIVEAEFTRRLLSYAECAELDMTNAQNCIRANRTTNTETTAETTYREKPSARRKEGELDLNGFGKHATKEVQDSPEGKLCLEFDEFIIAKGLRKSTYARPNLIKWYDAATELVQRLDQQSNGNGLSQFEAVMRWYMANHKKGVTIAHAMPTFCERFFKIELTMQIREGIKPNDPDAPQVSRRVVRVRMENKALTDEEMEG